MIEDSIQNQRTLDPPNLRLFLRRCCQQCLSPYRAHVVAKDVERLSGLEYQGLQPTDLVVLALIRNGERHLEEFVSHHMRLGARMVVLLDNGSTDNTIAIARKLANVVVLRSTLPYREFQYEFRRFLVSRYGSHGWCLMVDIDERFDYPLSDRLPLDQFLAYLNLNQYTSVPADLLDLFPEGPIDTWPLGGRALIEASQWYDISSVSEFWPRLDGLTNRYSVRPRHLRGGIRQMAFGLQPTLTKYPLLYGPAGVRPVSYSSHFSQGGMVADISCLLAHYKFDSTFQSRCLEAVRRGNYYDNSREYRAYLEALGAEPSLTLKRSTARRLRSIADLVEAGFVRCSGPYAAFVKRFEARMGGGALSAGNNPSGNQG